MKTSQTAGDGAVRDAMDLVSSEMATIADSSGGISHLRDIIVQAAIMGRLGTQRPEDKSAVDLAALGERLAREGRTRQRPSEDVLPRPGWALPASWTWSCPFDLGIMSPRNDISDSAEVGFVPMALVPTDYREPVRSEPRKWGEIKKGYTHFADGDIAVARITPCFQNGKSCVMNGLPGKAGAGSTEYHVLRPFAACVVPQYLLLFFKTPYFISGGVSRMTGTAGQQRVPGEYFAFVPVPLPPLAEQKRIVAKVDQLMALCDDLEAKQTKKRDLATQSTRSALTALTAAETPADRSAAWTRVLENWPSLVDRPENVGDLGKTVLALAITGGLDDTKLPRMAQPAPRDAQAMDELPFAIPDGWGCSFLDDVVEARLGKMLDKAKNRGRPCPYLRNTNVRWFRFELDSIKEMLFTDSDLVEYGLRAGDVLVCEGGHGIGRTAVWDGQREPMMFQKALHRLRPRPILESHFLSYQLRVADQSGYLARFYTGAGIPHLTGRSLAKFPVVLPLPAEQKRIVAKVDQLMSLLDDLEAKLRQQEETATRLAESLAAAVAA